MCVIEQCNVGRRDRPRKFRSAVACRCSSHGFSARRFPIAPKAAHKRRHILANRVGIVRDLADFAVRINATDPRLVSMVLTEWFYHTATRAMLHSLPFSLM